MTFPNDTSNITSAQYVADERQQNSSIIAVFGDSTVSVPLDPDNRHYAAILRWVEAGNTILPAD